MMTLCDSCEVRTEARFHFVVVTLCDSCEVRTESRFHLVLVMLCDSCEVRTESLFHFVAVKCRKLCNRYTTLCECSSDVLSAIVLVKWFVLVV
jgi:hypothetical protein